MVTTTNAKTLEVDSVKEIDHGDKSDRIWLGRHCFWAIRNGLKVSTEPLNA
jgi:hypothetical protein